MSASASPFRRIALGLLVLITVVAGISIWWSGSQQDPEAAFQQTLLDFKNDYESAGLSKRHVFAEYYDALTPVPMLVLLDRSFPQCHNEGHELGMVVYERVGELVEAINLCDHHCTGGCMHGVVLEAFSQNSFEELTADLDAFCKRGAMANRYKPGNCAHSLGHALMMASGRDLAQSLNGCNLFELDAMRYYCATGAYMEYFNTIFRPDPAGGFHGPCNEFDLYPAACYRYKTSEMAYLMDNNWDAAAAECDTLSHFHRLGCYHGLGHGVRQAVMDEAYTVGDICERGRHEDAQMCIEGLIEKWQDWNPAAALAACNSVSESLKPTCTAAANDGMYRLDKPTIGLYLGN